MYIHDISANTNDGTNSISNISLREALRGFKNLSLQGVKAWLSMNTCSSCMRMWLCIYIYTIICICIYIYIYTYLYAHTMNLITQL